MERNHDTRNTGNESTEAEKIINQKLEMIRHNPEVTVSDITNIWNSKLESHYSGPICDGFRMIKINYDKTVETQYISSNEDFGAVWVLKIIDNGNPEQVLLYANQTELAMELITIRQIVGDKP